MGSVVIVGVEKPVDRAAAGVIGPLGPDVGPFLEQGPVEPFDLAVRLRPAGPNPHVLHAQVRQGLTEGHGLDVDAVCGEERVRPRVEAGTRVAGLVREDL